MESRLSPLEGQSRDSDAPDPDDAGPTSEFTSKEIYYACTGTDT